MYFKMFFHSGDSRDSYIKYTYDSNKLNYDTKVSNNQQGCKQQNGRKENYFLSFASNSAFSSGVISAFNSSAL